MESLEEAMMLIEEGEWLAKIDLKDAYNHLRLREEDSRYFRFQLDGVHYEWSRMVFVFCMGI